MATEVKALEEKVSELEKKLTGMVEVLPNIPDADVPAGEKEANEVVKIFGKQPEFKFPIKDHIELGKELNLFDLERAAKLSGNNFSMYTGMGARLEWALINYLIDAHIKDGYEMIIPPHIVGEESGYCAGQLPKFRKDVTG